MPNITFWKLTRGYKHVLTLFMLPIHTCIRVRIHTLAHTRVYYFSEQHEY
jgi:hypothetical protein